MQIGNGTVFSGVFSAILWGNAAHFIKLEADFNGGSNYVLLGTQELMSVPYELYASKTDTSSLNLAGRFSEKLNMEDTFILSNRINNKLNTSDFPLGTTLGNMQYWNGTTWVSLAPGLPGQILSADNTGKPVWLSTFPVISTNSVSDVNPCSGNISSDGGSPVTERGVVWSINPNPTISLSTKTR